jgi:hypothetical protein
MKFSYDDRDYVLDPDELTGAEAEMIEDAGGTQWETFGEWISRLYRGGWRPLKVALWVMMRRENPRLDYEELANVKIADVQIDLTDEDVAEGNDSSEPATEPAATALADSPTDSDLPKPDTEASPSN